MESVSFYQMKIEELKKKHNYKGLTDGFYVFLGKEIQGYSKTLHYPEKWFRGSVAIDKDGNRFLGIGNDNVYAEKWVNM